VKVLVTGAGGFLGRNLADSLCQDYEIFAPSRAELNLLDTDAVRDYLEHYRFDAVVHAATVRANRRIGAPTGLLQDNCRMFFNLARNAEAFGKMLFLSSGAVYDRRGPVVRISETCFDSRVPADPYGFSKYICAHNIAQSANLYELRLFGVFGRYEAWDVRFISNACARVVKGLPIVIRQNVKFDYLYVSELAGLVAWFLDHEPRQKAYNVCRGEAYTLLELAEMVAAASGRDPEIRVRNQTLGPEYSADNARMLEEMGGFRFRGMSDCIRELYQWYEENADRIGMDQLTFDESE